MSSQQRLRLIFVGTGVSTGVPVIGHGMNSECACEDAIADQNSKNRRNNVSLLVQEWDDDIPELVRLDSLPAASEMKTLEEIEKAKKENEEKEAERKRNRVPVAGWGKNVLIDVGKTFRSAYFQTLAPRKIQTIDAIVITHEHANAMGGLDEVRDLQNIQCVAPNWHWNVVQATPTFVSPFCLNTLKRSVAYIVDNSRVQKGFFSRPLPGFEENHPYCASEAARLEILEKEKQQGILPHGGPNGPVSVPEPWKSFIIPRRVTALDFYLLDENHGPFEFTVTPGNHRGKWFGVPLEHGCGYTCLGYVFGETPATRVVYLSDVSKISDVTMKFLKSDLVQPIRILVVDGLLPFGEREHFSHYTLDQAWDLTKELDPKESFCVGMWCKVFHQPTCDKMTEMVADYRQKNEGVKLEKFALAYDGQEIILE
jgi:phosphoribosyl 1,2-cyclic phosphodiesterase